jgi:hypothetical protein
VALFTFIGLLARQNVSSQFLLQAIPPAPSSPELEPSSLAPEEASSPDSVIISSAPSQSGEGTADPATIASTEASRQVKENLKRSNFECEETNNSVSMRRTLIRESLQILPSAGLFGIGLSSFAGISCLTRDPHNSILQAAVEFGPLGGLFLALIASFVGFLHFLLWRSAEFLHAYHIGLPQQPSAAVALPTCLALLLGSIFIFAGFSFGYFAGFYLFTIVAGYLWVNTFSVLDYDQAAAFWLAAFSLILFLIPALTTWKVSIERRPFVLPKRSPEAILIIATGVLAVSSFHGFYLVGIEGMIEHRDDIVRSAGMNYVIGN